MKLQGTKCNRDAIGAKITWSVKGATRARLKNSGGSYLSSHDPREVLGLDAATRADWVEIRWPALTTSIEFQISTRRGPGPLRTAIEQVGKAHQFRRQVYVNLRRLGLEQWSPALLQ